MNWKCVKCFPELIERKKTVVLRNSYGASQLPLTHAGSDKESNQESLSFPHANFLSSPWYSIELQVDVLKRQKSTYLIGETSYKNHMNPSLFWRKCR